jgi:hypothetical protein
MARKIVAGAGSLMFAVSLTLASLYVTDWAGAHKTFVFRAIIVCLLGAVGAFIFWLCTEGRRHASPGKLSLEIIFDSANPGHQFWSPKVIDGIQGIEYRLKIKNKTNKTLHQVKATTEAIGPLGSMPTRLIFDQNGEPIFALDPEASAFVKLFFAPLPIIQPGTLVGESSAAYGPIRVTVSALDTAAVETTFQFKPLRIGFDPFEEPMIS